MFLFLIAKRPTARRNQRQFSQPGQYAGRAIYQPIRREGLKPGLFSAIGHVVELQFAGVAERDEPFPGQNLYQEYRRNALLHSSWVPEEDLQFIDVARQRPS
jgi:hypothetical protein